jgi:hypothetical protein
MDPNALEGASVEVTEDFDPATTGAYADEPRDPPEGCEFSAWLFRQEERPDPIGQLARVVRRDPLWQGGDRAQTDKYLKDLGANDVTRAVLRLAWTAYEQNLQAAKAKRAQRQARKRQRAARKRSRK